MTRRPPTTEARIDLRTILSAGMIALLLLACAGAATGAVDVYVNETGWWRDGGAFNASGTPIQAAVGAADAGDVVEVRSGTYNENVIVNKRLTLEGVGMPIVNAGATGGNGFTVNVDGCTINGFRIVNSGLGWYCVFSGIYVASNKNKLINNIVTSGNGYGIDLWNSCNNTLSGKATPNK